jgi:hypothetical protein
MAPQVIQIGSGKKNGGNGLLYAVGALGTAFAVDYWLSTKKMEEELAAENAEHISAEKAKKALEEIQEEPKEEQPAPLNETSVREISRFSNADDFSEGELETFLPKNEISISGPFKTFEPIEEEPEDLKILPEEEDVVEIVEPLSRSEPIKMESTSFNFFEQLPVALWKLVLIVVLALLWQYGKPATRTVIPGLNEEFEGETEQPEVIPMLGSTDSTETAIAVAVDDLKKEPTTSNKQTNSLGELTFHYEEEEEKWGIVAIICLAMMIL